MSDYDDDPILGWMDADERAAYEADNAASKTEAAAAATVRPARTRPAGLRPGSRRTTGAGDRDYRYVGVVRLNGRTVTECGHEHRNRDWTTGAAGKSALDCARDIIDGARRPEFADYNARRLADVWTALTGTAGFAAPASTIAAAKTTAAESAAAYLAAVDAVRATGATPANAKP